MYVLPDAGENAKFISKSIMVIKEFITAYNIAVSEVEELTQKQSNILHKMENKKILYRERAKMGTELQRIRINRRKYKEWITQNKQVMKLLETDRGENFQTIGASLVGEFRKSAKTAEILKLTKERIEKYGY